MKHFLTTRKGVTCFANFKTNITTRTEPILRQLAILTTYALFAFPQNAAAQCPAPTGLTALNIGQNTASLRWTSNDTPTDNCWVVTVAGQGLANCNNGGQALFQTVVCYLGNVTSFSAPVTAMTVVGNQITVTVGSLQPGTDYEFFVSETCNGIAPPNNVSPCAGPTPFSTLDAQYAVTATVVAPTCPFISPGYVPNGSFTVTVTNGNTCAGTYTVNAAPVAGSGPGGSTPPATATTTYVGFPAGAFLFANAGAGTYTVTVTETGACNPPTDPVVIQVVVPNGTDTAAPTFYVTDVLGNILADNDPLTAAGPVRNFGNVSVPAGECGRQDEYYVYGIDACDGFITAGNAVSATATTTPSGISPATQVSVTPDGFGFYLVDVHWSTGTSTVSVRGRDAAGNIANGATGLQLIMTVPDNIDPVVHILGPAQVIIPVCAASVTGVYTFQVDDACDQVPNFANLTVSFGAATGVINFTGNNYREYLVTFPAPGDYLFSGVYVDASGNVGFIDQIIHVTQAVANLPPVIQANAETVTLPACQTCQQVTYSFVISDDCAPIDITQVQFNGGGSGLPTLNGLGFFFVDAVSCATLPCNSVYFEVRGCVHAGTFFPLISYQGITANPTLTVLQNANQPADIELPAINATLPLCQSTSDVEIPITIEDDCDNPIVPANASFSLGGVAITPDFVNAASGYFEFARTLTAANNGQLLVATYTDAAGVVSTANTLITVNAQPDTWAPVIIYPSQDIVVELAPCDPPAATVSFQVTVADQCTSDILPNITVNTGAQVVNTGGNTYSVTVPPGNHLVTITATDASGNVRQEDFSIQIHQESSGPASLACNDTLNIALNADCQALLTPEMLLEGAFGCLDAADFVIQVVDGNLANGPIVDGCGTFNYHISLQPGLNVPGFSNCWGVIHTDDLTPPTLVCPENTNEILTAQAYQEVAGALAATDGTFQPGLEVCWLQAFNLPAAAAPRFYDAYTFTVSETDVYTFDLYDANGADWIGGIFRNGFDPQNACLDVISQQLPNTLALGIGTYIEPFGLVFANGDQPRWRISLELHPGITYSLATTSFDASFPGSYTWRVYSAGNGQVNGLPLLAGTERRTLMCEDESNIALATLPANVPRCYKTDGDGNVIFPTNPTERQRYQQLLDRLAGTGYPNANAATALGGSVTDNDHCGFMEICVTETFTSPVDCNDGILTRTFTVKDEQDGNFDGVNTTPCSGSPNQSVCVQEIRIRKPRAADIILPPFTAFFECGQTFATDANGNPDPSVSGYPVVRRAFGVATLNDVYCNLSASYFDMPRAMVCEHGYKFQRQWTLFDWCFPAQTTLYTQIIKVGDMTAPTVSCPFEDQDGNGIADPLVYTTGTTDCTAAFSVPLPEVTDSCSDWTVLTEIITEIVNGTDVQQIVLATIAFDAPSRFISGVPVGCHSFRYTVTDDCGNAAIESCSFCVVDETDPVAVCNDDLNISIGGNGYARIYKESVDEGSWDNCGLAQLQVRRLWTADSISCAAITPVYSAWGEYIDVNCCDVGQEILIELRATDNAGNTNTCWMNVLVEDKIKPSCTPPLPVTISCSDLPGNFNIQDTLQAQALFGNATATDNCPGVTTRELPPLYGLSDCGYGTIVRRFQAIDAAGNVSVVICTQLITVTSFHNYEITFPKDAAAHCGMPMPDTILHKKYGCDLLAVSVLDEELVASEDECYKILRKYRVLNWCEYNGVDSPVVISRDEDCDNQPGDEAVWVLHRNDQSYVDRDSIEFNHRPGANSKNIQCDGFTNPEGYWRTARSTGFWEYTQSIKVYDTIPPRVYFSQPPPFCSYDNVDCNVEIEYKFLVSEICTPYDVTMKLFYDEDFDGIIDQDVPEEGIAGQYPKFEVTKQYPIGSHAFVLELTDGCGNLSRTNLPFQVVDCKAPNPVCINGLAIPLMRADPDTDVDGDGEIDSGVAVIEAVDFLVSPLSDCLGPIQYSINRFGEAPDINQTSLIFTCADLGPQTVEIYGWDQAFNPYAIQPDGTLGGRNYDHCITYIIVQDNEVNACSGGNGSGSSAIMGIIETEDAQPVAQVNVQISGGVVASDLTDASGAYFLSGLQPDYDYTLIPELDTDPLNGLSTLDLVLITRHILGEQLIDSPYKLIAADIDHSNHVSTIDLIFLRRLILGVDNDFTHNTSWRFVPRSYVFPNPANPWAPGFPEIININNLLHTVLTGQDFVGIKIGDVNGSASTDFNGQTELRENSSPVWELSAADRQLAAGETAVVPIKAGDLKQLQSLQFTLDWETRSLDFVALQPGVAGMEHLGQRFLKEGHLTLSWNQPAPADDPVLFTLSLRARKSVRLSEALRIAAWPTAVEAWHRERGKMNVALVFKDAQKESLALYQNEPNPFREVTTIRFYLPQAGEAALLFYTAGGQVLKRVKGAFEKGENAVQLNREEISGTGLVFYELRTANGERAVKRMIVQE